MTEYTSEHWEPYFDEEEAKAIIGMHLLVGVTHRNRSEEITGIERFHGEIIRANREEGIILRLSGSGEERWVPPDLFPALNQRPLEPKSSRVRVR